jgi:ubiquinone/menaquinone biosynthesis C-methylase UbiE
VKLNVCCGSRIYPDYTNVDVTDVAGKPDILADARDIPLEDGCADELMCIHGLEHFYQWEADDLFIEWKRLLKPGGVLVLELPNFRKACENVVANRMIGKHPDQGTLWSFYGDPRTKNPYMTHRWGYDPASLTALLKKHGFDNIREEPTQHHPVGRQFRDMRMVARKP